MHKQHYKEHGLSLVELMVGLTIGLIALLIMSQVLGVQTSQKQTTVSGADAQSSGSIALFTLERSIRMAGIGVDDNGVLMGCNVVGYYQMETTAIDPLEFRFVPLEITPGVGANAGTDSITIAYAMPQGSLTPTMLTERHDGSTKDFEVNNRFGLHLGDLLIIADGASDCAMVQVTSLSSEDAQLFGASASTYQDPGTRQEKPARYNKPGGTGMSFNENARVYNAGKVVSRTFSVNTATAQLLVSDNITGVAAQSIADGVVALRAMYGKDTDNDGSIDTYDTAEPASAAEWAKVIGVRLAVVARASKRETETVSPATLVLWSPRVANDEEEEEDEPADQGMSMSLSDEQRHYRYRVFQTLVPLRNMLWSIPHTVNR